jgi:hypothetical protein
MVLTTGKITTGKIKGTVVWPAMFFWRVQITTRKITTGKKNRSQNNPPENNVVPVPAKIWRELAPNYWPQLRRAPIKFGRFIKLYNINDKVLYKQTDMGFAAEAGVFLGGKGAVLPPKKV